MVQHYTRDAWTRVPRPAGLATLDGAELKGLAVHYEGGTRFGATCTLTESVQRLEKIRVGHVSPPPAGHGWSDIAYQAAIDQDGRVFDCRGIDYRSAANGDQAVNRSHGAVLFLLGVGDTPTLAAVDAFTSWRRSVWLRRWPNATTVVGHRDLHATECPGDPLYRIVTTGQWARPTPRQEDPMAINDADVDRIAKAVVDRLLAAPGSTTDTGQTAEYVARDGAEKVTITDALTRLLDRTRNGLAAR